MVMWPKTILPSAVAGPVAANAEQRWTCRPRLRSRATRTSTDSATCSSRRRAAGSRSRSGRASSASARPPAPTSARRRPASCRRSAWRRSSPQFYSLDRQIDKLWKPGNSIQLAIGQGDLTVTPMQMARFYALPRERRQARDAACADGRRELERHARAGACTPGAARSASTRRRSRSSRRVSGRRRTCLRDVIPGLRHLPRLDRRQDGHGGEGRVAARLRGQPGPVLVVRLRAVRRGEARRLRRDRERRPRRHRRGSGGGRGLRVFFHVR